MSFLCDVIRFLFPVCSMFCEMFRHLPVCSVIHNKVLVIHGGLFHREGVTLADIEQVCVCVVLCVFSCCVRCRCRFRCCFLNIVLNFVVVWNSFFVSCFGCVVCFPFSPPYVVLANDIIYICPFYLSSILLFVDFVLYSCPDICRRMHVDRYLYLSRFSVCF